MLSCAVISRDFRGFLYFRNMDKKRVIFYIDGFNFYYGIKRSSKINPQWGNAYWIDLVKLCEGFAAPDEIVEKVVYFTASPLNNEKNIRQSAFLNANKSINGERFEVVRGKYLEKQMVCPFCKTAFSRPEEKKTDVNISIRMIRDCIHNATDAITLVSADTDLMPPLELIKREFPKIKIRVYFPPANYSHDIAATLTVWKKRPTLLKNSYNRFLKVIMPDSVADGKYTIPPEWKSKQS